MESNNDYFEALKKKAEERWPGKEILPLKKVGDLKDGFQIQEIGGIKYASLDYHIEGHHTGHADAMQIFPENRDGEDIFDEKCGGC